MTKENILQDDCISLKDRENICCAQLMPHIGDELF